MDILANFGAQVLAVYSFFSRKNDPKACYVSIIQKTLSLDFVHVMSILAEFIHFETNQYINIAKRVD